MDSDGFVPVYLEDRTVIGRAKVNPDGTILVEMDEETGKKLFTDSLVGFSVFSTSGDRGDEAIAALKGDEDGRGSGESPQLW